MEDNTPAELARRRSAERTAYTKGLRMLADVLDAHDEVPLPFHGSGTEITIHFLFGEDARGDLASAARALPCDWRKGARGGNADESGYFDMHGKLAGLAVKLTAYRDAVCTRVVTGTEDREVEEVVEPAVTRTVTKPFEIVTWECGLVMAPAGTDVAA